MKDIQLTLGEEYEIVERLKAHENPWITVPESDILRTDQELPNEHCPALEIKLNNVFLKDKVNILIPPDCSSNYTYEILQKYLTNVLPVIIYIISDDTLNDEVRIFLKTLT